MNTRPIRLSSMLAGLAAAAALATACTSLGHKGASADDDGLAAASAQETVVIQAGQESPVVAGHDRAYWLDLRKQKDLMTRLRGALATGEAETSINLAKARLAKAPGDPEALTMLAAALALTRNYDLAAYYAGLLERARPGDAVALNIKGLAIMLSSKARLADFKQAQAYFQAAMNADPGQIAPGLNLGNLQLELGNPAGAAQTFGDVVGRCGQCTAALIGLGIAQSRSHDLTKAVASFQAVLSKNPKHAGALYNLALVYKNGYNDNKQAEKYLFALLNDSRTKNVVMRQKAEVVLRTIKGEESPSARGMVADETPSAGSSDADLLMTGDAKDEN